MDNFLIIRLSSMGDIIHTLPAYAALRQFFPKAQISWLVEDKEKEILDWVPGLDKTIVMASKKRPATSRKYWVKTFHAVKETRNRDQVALDFQGLVKSGLYAYLSRSKTRIGFHKKNLKEPSAAIFYTEHLDPISEKMHVISKNLKLLTRIGIQAENFVFPIQIPEAVSRSVLEKIKFQRNSGKRLILLNIGAGWETKRWFFECWAELIDKLNERMDDLFLLLMWGSEEEKNLAYKIKSRTSAALAPFLTLKEVMALVKEADLLLSGDTFALQVACALACPVVAIFGPTNPERNGPFRSQDRVAFHELDCSHCYRRKCASLECMKRITPDEVLSLSLQRMEEHI